MKYYLENSVARPCFCQLLISSVLCLNNHRKREGGICSIWGEVRSSFRLDLVIPWTSKITAISSTNRVNAPSSDSLVATFPWPFFRSILSKGGGGHLPRYCNNSMPHLDITVNFGYILPNQPATNLACIMSDKHRFLGKTSAGYSFSSMILYIFLSITVQSGNYRSQ